MELNKITKEIRDQLRKPFPPEALGTVASKSYLTSIKAMYVIERLNDVFGVGRWTLEHSVIKEQAEQVLIQGELKILDYNIIVPAQYGSHKITGKGVEIADGYKSAITDCITKSASYLEIGIDVFKGKVSSTGKKSYDKTDDTPIIWISETNFKTYIKYTDKEKLSSVITGFSNSVKDGKKYCMKKDYSEKLKEHLNTLK